MKTSGKRFTQPASVGWVDRIDDTPIVQVPVAQSHFAKPLLSNSVAKTDRALSILAPFTKPEEAHCGSVLPYWTANEHASHNASV